MTRPHVLVAGLLLVAGCQRSSEPTNVQPSRGRVLSLNRRPLSGSLIRMTGCADQVTACDGSFDTSCAATPYDLAATHGTTGIVYQGLTRPDPVATIPVVVSSDGASRIIGTVLGRTDDREAGVSITTTAMSSKVSEPAFDGFYSSYVLWLDTSPWASIRAIEWTGTSSGPTAFTAYGEVRVPLLAAVEPTGSPTLQPIANGTLSVSIEATHPEMAEGQLRAEWREGEVTHLADFWPGSSRASIPTPDVPGVAFTVVFVDADYEQSSSGYTSGWRRGVPATAAPDPITLPTAAAFTTPRSDDLVDLSTDFTYTAVPGAVYLLSLESGVTSDPRYYVVTSDTTSRIPDLSWAGVPAPRWSGATYYTASVSALGPFTSVDDVAAGPIPVEPDEWAWQQPFAIALPTVDGFATRHRMTVRVR